MLAVKTGRASGRAVARAVSGPAGTFSSSVPAGPPRP